MKQPPRKSRLWTLPGNTVLFSERSHGHRKKNRYTIAHSFRKRGTALLLILMLVLSGLPIQATSANAEQMPSLPPMETGEAAPGVNTDIAQRLLRTAKQEGRASGLVGFVGDWDSEDLAATEAPVSVIVELTSPPAGVQQAAARKQGRSLPLLAAEKTAQEDQIAFETALSQLFASRQPSPKAAPYQITTWYHDALNGAAVTIPSDQLEAVADLDMVFAVYPNRVIQISQEETPDEENIDSLGSSDGDPFSRTVSGDTQVGMDDTRAFLHIDEIRETMELTGKGVTVGVLDTGVDYNHPDLKAAFSTSYNGTGDLEPINGVYYGRNLIDDSQKFPALPRRSPFDPMELTYTEWKASGYNEYREGRPMYTLHGTHVSGIIGAKGTQEGITALGMAPDVTLLAYRVLGAYSSGETKDILAGLDKVYEDGCDIVNLSLGSDSNEPTDALNLAVNNLTFAHDILFCVATGNAGPEAYSANAPSTSLLSFAVGNGVLGNPPTLHRTSARGPAFHTNYIRPDLVAPGTEILSTIPLAIPREHPYQTQSGTSMATPHVTGIAALLLEYSDKNDLGWSMQEIKTRLMNTADPMAGYSVHQTGVGFINPLAALKAPGTVSVKQNLPALSSERDPLVQVPAFHFGLLFSGPIPAAAKAFTITNRSPDDLSYTLSITRNTSGFSEVPDSPVASDSLWDAAGLRINATQNRIRVPAGQSQTLELILSFAQSALPKDCEGIYEATVVLTNQFDPTDILTLPFSVTLRDSNFFSSAYLNKPVLTTRGIADDRKGEPPVHLEKSYQMDLHLTFRQAVERVEFLIMDAAVTDLSDESQWMGHGGNQISGSYYPSERPFVLKNWISPYYLDSSDRIALLEPGCYQLVAAAAVNGYKGYQSIGKFYVDDTPPELFIDDLAEEADNPSGKNTLFYRDDPTTATITGSLYDNEVSILEALGLSYEIYRQLGDPEMTKPNQGFNAIFARIKGEDRFTQGLVDSSGNFRLELEGLSKTGKTEVSLYYYDHFSVGNFQRNESSLHLPAEYTRDFSPDCALQQGEYGENYASYGSNQEIFTITLAHEGPAVVLDRDSIALAEGQSHRLNPSLNDEAERAGYQDFHYQSSDETVVQVAEDGTLTGKDFGSAVITVSSENISGSRISSTLDVYGKGISDGVELPLGSRVYFGSGYYSQPSYDLENRDQPWNGSYKNYVEPRLNRMNLPYLWRVMGQETVSGIGDGYLTLFSEYPWRIHPYQIKEGDPYCPYEESDLHRALQSSYYSSAFTDAEKQLIPDTAVQTNQQTLLQQKLYLPMGINSDSEDPLAGAIFWSASGDAGHRIKGGTDALYRGAYYNKQALAAYFLRNGDDEQGKVRIVHSVDGTVTTPDSPAFFGNGYGWNQGRYQYLEAGNAVRPLTKLDLRQVVYAYPQSISAFDIPLSDRPKYIYGIETQTLYNHSGEAYKLSVQDPDVGVVRGLPQEPVLIEEGQRFSAVGVTSSRFGDDYRLIYKIVGTADRKRQILGYGESRTASAPQPLFFDSNALPAGEYTVYTWLQRSSLINSYEAGTVSSFDLIIQPLSPADVSEGVSLKAGDQIYYGNYAHATHLREGSGRAVQATSWEEKNSPILWTVLGEETNDGSGDTPKKPLAPAASETEKPALTLMSQYVLDTTPYTNASRAMREGNYVIPDYNDTNIHLWLQQTLDSGFTRAESNGIQRSTVARTSYPQDAKSEEENPPTGIQIKNQKFYLPWGTEVLEEAHPSVHGVFWSASDARISANALAYPYRGPSDQTAATLKNGAPASYFLGGADGDGIYYVERNGNFSQSSEPMTHINPGREGGIRPITKLSLNQVVYAAKIGEHLPADDVNYRIPDETKQYYKLTVLGEHGGRDIGTLGGLPSDVTIDARSSLPLPDLIVSAVPAAQITPPVIGYKILSEDHGASVIEKGGTVAVPTGTEEEEAKPFVLPTETLSGGRYRVFLWLQKDQPFSSNEAGVVSEFSLTIEGGDEPTTGIEKWLHTNGKTFVSGYPNGTFLPGGEMTRGEVASLFYELLLDKEVPITKTFPDNAEEIWYKRPIEVLASLEILNGYDDGEFKPKNPISRGEFLSIAVKFADLEVDTSQSFFDDVTDEWFASAVNRAYQYGWVKGYLDGTYKPRNSIARCEVVSVVSKLLGREPDKEYIHEHFEELLQFSDLDSAHWAYYVILDAANQIPLSVE